MCLNKIDLQNKSNVATNRKKQNEKKKYFTGPSIFQKRLLFLQLVKIASLSIIIIITIIQMNNPRSVKSVIPFDCLNEEMSKKKIETISLFRLLVFMLNAQQRKQSTRAFSIRKLH